MKSCRTQIFSGLRPTRLLVQAILLFMCNTITHAQKPPLHYLEGFYAGVHGGLGSTTWEGLIPPMEKQNSAILISTPVRVREGGTVYGFFGGYDFTPHFGLELMYSQYPDARVDFSKFSLFAFKHNKRTYFNTSTKVFGLLAKLMIDIPETPFRLYSGAGLAKVCREDELLDQSRQSPTFSLGLMYDMTKHLMLEITVNYTAGFGVSELNPASTYIPFLYSGTFGLAYKF